MESSGSKTSDLHFPSTHWSSVMAAAETESEEGWSALGKMLTRYRPALKAYQSEKLQGCGEQALDLFQSFALELVLTMGLIAEARRNQGGSFAGFQFCELILEDFELLFSRREMTRNLPVEP